MLRPACLIILAALLIAEPTAGRESQPPIAITSVTLIDGTGSEPQSNTTVIVENGLIRDIGRDGAADLPAGAMVIDGAGRFLLPGFIDSNVHATVYGNSRRRETVVKYGERNEELALEFLQRQLMYGVTTVRDSYGALVPLMAVRDRIEAGAAIGARILVAGNIIGWGGPFSMTFSLMQESDLTLFQARWNDWIAQGAGEELLDMGPAEVREAINAYLDKGPNFIKYGGTSHFQFPSLIGFSPRIQQVIVQETHKRGLVAETHATSPEALRIAVEAGIDLIQHPEILSRDYPDDLLRMIVDRDILCAMRSNTLAGETLRDHLAQKAAAERAIAQMDPPRTSAERRERESMLNEPYEIQRRNARRLIAAGCRVTIATDNYQGDAPEFRKSPKPFEQEAGIGSLLAVEGLVEIGMSEMQAIVAGTRNGAIAAGMLESIGTIERGKVADLVLLADDPLEDIRNIRRIEQVIARGRLIDRSRLPEKALFLTGHPPGFAVPDAATADPAPPRVEQKAPATPAASGKAAQADARGNEDGYPRSAAVRSVERNARGKLIVELENGETWRQLDSDNTAVPLPDNVTDVSAAIRRGLFGSWSIELSGTGRPFRAARIN